MTSKARTHTIIGLLLLIALVIGACDSQISDPETSIHNKANERITEGAPAFEDQLGDGCLRWRDSEDFSAFRKTADQPDWPTCKEVREQRKQKIETTFNALKALYRATTTNSSEWLTNRGWDTTNVPTSMEAFNDWYGLTVVGGDLTGLTLDIDLTEPLPPEIGNLTNLTRLDLRGDFTGIPAEIGNLTNLEDLSLSSNQLTGPIPSEIGNLTNLTHLRLFGNELTGTIPAEIGNLTNLEWLNLGGNELTGTIPAEIGNLTNLTAVGLHKNQLTGKLPQELVGATKMSTLAFSENAGLCAPANTEFQAWLNGIRTVNGPTCSD
ncbi:MAG: hypothetical protein OXF84_06635 [Bacteroidetes bacterium]|nr:hypothetical protein [Bacteroidota bacterium]